MKSNGRRILGMAVVMAVASRQIPTSHTCLKVEFRPARHRLGALARTMTQRQIQYVPVMKDLVILIIILCAERTKLGSIYDCRNKSRSIQGLFAAVYGAQKPLCSSHLLANTLHVQEPKPEQIRPFHVLQRTLDELKKRWKQKPAPTYNWMCSQFKSLRQDLTVRSFPLSLYVTDDIRVILPMSFTGTAHQKSFHCNRV